ncbi:unnamed protein product [Pylaiella littoralis]
MRSAAVAVACGLALASLPTPNAEAVEHTREHRAAAAATTTRSDRLALNCNNRLRSPIFTGAAVVNFHHQRRPPQQQQQRRGNRRCCRSRYAMAAAATRSSDLDPTSCFLAPLCPLSRDGVRGEQRRRSRNKQPLAMRGSDDEGGRRRRSSKWDEGDGSESGSEGATRKAGAPMPRMVSWGLNSRSQPNARKALGSSSKTHTIVHVCEVCGSEHVQWVGRCPTCKEWNCVKPFKVRREQGSNPSRVSRAGVSAASVGVRPGGGGDLEFSGLAGGAFGSSGGAGWLPEDGFAVPMRLSEVGEAEKQERMPLPGSELPRVLGGGLVPGSMVMLGGDPGVGKSTLLLQLAGQLASSQAGCVTGTFEEKEDDDRHQGEGRVEEGGDAGAKADAEAFRAGTVVYISGEENNSQVAARAKRMGISGVDLFLYCETDIDVIIDQASVLSMQPQPALVMVDSIQTMRTQDSTSSPGSVTQVKECASRLVRLAKGSGITVFIVGHVTKSGSIAGPKVVEHMVDTVLYLEGDRFNSYRLLRSVKNRFGPSNEIGVFQMESGGLDDVADPSMLFLSDKHVDGDEGDESMDGSAVCVYMEGSRPILCELQSLVTYSRLPSPRRTSDGLPVPRLLLLLAVLQKRLGYDMGSREVYLNIVGGLKVQETAADLAVALAVVSSYTTIPVRSDTCFIGEIGLGGELRPVQQLPRRIQEAETFGFSRVVVPFTRKNRSAGPRRGRGADGGKVAASTAAVGSRGGGRRGEIEVVECRNLKDAVAAGLTAVPKKRSYNRSGRRPSPSTSPAAREGGRRGRYEPSSSSSAEPEFGWQQRKSPPSGDGNWDDGGGEEQDFGFDDGGGGGGGDDVEGFEGGWGGEEGRYGGGSGEAEGETEWQGGGERNSG